MDKRSLHDANQRSSAGFRVLNRDLLTGHGEVDLRQIALEIFESAIEASDPGAVTRDVVELDGQTMKVAGRTFKLDVERKLFVIGAGKATFPIAKALEDVLGAKISAGLISVKSAPTSSLSRIRTIVAQHPFPNHESVQAARETLRLLEEVRPGDVVIACFTGGSSSLFALPAEGISFADKLETNRILLGCGANIVEINSVRKHISQVKGGRLSRSLPKGAVLINLTVSDVVGDRIDCITDPTVPDASTFADAIDVVDRYALWDVLPKSVATHIRRADPRFETCSEADFGHLERIDHFLLRADAACSAAMVAAKKRGIAPMLLSTFFEGESSQLARSFGAIARQVVKDGNPVQRPCVLIGGGETTVTIGDSFGLGGPNQEFAVKLALELDGIERIVGLGADTDGSDGPTNYAGALVDGTTAARLRGLGADPGKALKSHDVTEALRLANDLIETGPTGTNVNDLKLVLIGELITS